jgi:transcriptional regulator with XRE-family HTH domain
MWPTRSAAMRSQMYEIEMGKQNPTYKVLQAIADLRGVKLSKLFALAEKKYERSYQ